MPFCTMSCKIANLWDNDLKFLTSILIILQKSSSCISRKQAVCAFFYFPYPWFTDQTKYVKYLFWSRASLWGLTSSKNLMFIRSVVSEILPPLESQWKVSKHSLWEQSTSVYHGRQKLLPTPPQHTNWFLFTEMNFWVIEFLGNKFRKESLFGPH